MVCFVKKNWEGGKPDPVIICEQIMAIIHLGGLLPSLSSDPHGIAEHNQSSLWGLASDRVYHVIDLSMSGRGLGRPRISPMLLLLQEEAVCFLLHFP